MSERWTFKEHAGEKPPGIFEATRLPGNFYDQAGRRIGLFGSKSCRLIAAAPEMLDALNLAVSALEAVDENHLGTASDANSEWPIRDEVLSKLRAAIAKAEGR